MYVSVDTILTASAVVGAVSAFVTLFWKLFKWIEHQKEQDVTISEIKEDIKTLKQRHHDDVHTIQEEQTLVMYGLLACLKGLQEQGCNGAVTEAIGKIDKYLNQRAHEN